ncbi:serine hydrolase [Rhodococcus sp. ARC_M5]|uniref:serine hydrolase n=1 Tax=Rhodococcus sp. ARC_M5 TaxID=2928851 RepID=UPI001FB4177A|nr:serine hydrolase [Rhodococcus sp. ARC_M5]MCJ0893218.1 class A beta-lactamase-related serine hydrolase [Rhodococcus sp. ARC_M5]
MVRGPRFLAAVCACVLLAGCSAPSDDQIGDLASKATAETSASPFPDMKKVDGVALGSRIPMAIASAQARGADVDFALLDRRTGSYYSSNADLQVETASVSKLFIADEVLFRAQSENRPVSADELAVMTNMLELSDDNAAYTLWYRYGSSEIVRTVAARYGLTNTTAPGDDQWYNTETTPSDLVGYYAGLLNGSGGLTTASTDIVIGMLRRSAPIAADGYKQHFGIVDGLPGESVHAVKQGWMCCVSDRWVHLSTGTIGVDNRYVLALSSREDIFYADDMEQYPDTAVVDVSDDASALHARETLTGFVSMLFPDGAIG